MTDDKEIIELDNKRDVEYGRIRSRLLFKQHNKEGKEDINVWRETFVSALDPTEYTGGIALLGSWSEWERFKRNWPSFQRLYLDDWLDEIEVRLKSLAIKSLKEDAKDGGAASAKFLAEGRYKEKSAGRPTKAAVKRQTKIDAALERSIANDRERLGL